MTNNTNGTLERPHTQRIGWFPDEEAVRAEVVPEPIVRVDTPIKLNIGSGLPGEVSAPQPEGYTPIDARLGHDLFKLDYADNSVEEIYASHVLEHISHQRRSVALAEWFRVLRPGGRVRISVPDFKKIVEVYQSGRRDIPIEGIMYGGQDYPENFHHSGYDEDSLWYWMDKAGFVGIDKFAPEFQDCSQLSTSLNMEGYKPPPLCVDGKLSRRVIGAMSVPRLLFLDQVESSEKIVIPMGIPVSRHTGSNWGQCLERCFGQIVEQGYEWILAMDYDTVFTESQFIRLLTLFEAYGDEFDALAPLQIKREDNRALYWRNDKKPLGPEQLSRPIFRADSAHFGCTLIKVDILKKMPHPWFQHVPAPDGSWGDGRIDDDIYFWQQFQKAGGRLGVTSRLCVGHLQMMVSWLGEGYQPVHQYVNDFRKNGPPLGTGATKPNELSGAKGAG